MAWVDREQLGQTALIGTVDADPTLAGLVAPVGSFAMLDTGAGAWRKSNAGNLGWTPMSGMTRAIVGPLVTDDDAHGQEVDSIWYDTVAGIGYVCTDNTTGAAVWIPIVADEDAQFAINGKFRAMYDFATDGGVVGANVFGPFLPDNAWVTEAFYEVITTFASPTADNATVALGHADDAAGLVVAAAINVGTAFDATGVAIVTLADNVPANFLTKTTAARQLAITIAVEDITAGRMVVFGEYATTE